MTFPKPDQQYDPYTIYQNLTHNSYGVERFGGDSTFVSAADAWVVLWKQLSPEVQEETRNVFNKLLPQLSKEAKQPDFNPRSSALLKQLRKMGVPESRLQPYIRPHRRRRISLWSRLMRLLDKALRVFDR